MSRAKLESTRWETILGKFAVWTFIVLPYRLSRFQVLGRGPFYDLNFRDKRGRSSFATKVLLTICVQFGVLAVISNTMMYSFRLVFELILFSDWPILIIRSANEFFYQIETY